MLRKTSIERTSCAKYISGLRVCIDGEIRFPMFLD